MSDFYSVLYVEREIAPSNEGGVDFSRDGYVIARSAHMRLVWRTGGTYWSGMAGHRYSTSALSLLAPPTPPGGLMDRRITTRLIEGGRMSIARILSLRETLDKTFGQDATERIAQAWRSKRTVVFCERRPRFQKSGRSMGKNGAARTE